MHSQWASKKVITLPTALAAPARDKTQISVVLQYSLLLVFIVYVEVLYTFTFGRTYSMVVVVGLVAFMSVGGGGFILNYFLFRKN